MSQADWTFNAIGSAPAGTAVAPTPITSALQSSSADCATAGIADKFTVSFASPSAGAATDAFKLSLTNVAYNVGTNAALGKVTVNATGTNGLGSGSAVSAEVVGTSFSYSGFDAVLPFADPKSLGTATITESGADASFPTGTKTLRQTISEHDVGPSRSSIWLTSLVARKFVKSARRTQKSTGAD